jgi:hypothetical protein
MCLKQARAVHARRKSAFAESPGDVLRNAAEIAITPFRPTPLCKNENYYEFDAVFSALENR